MTDLLTMTIRRERLRHAVECRAITTEPVTIPNTSGPVTYATPRTPRVDDVPSIHATHVGSVPTSTDGPLRPRVAPWLRGPSHLGQRLTWTPGYATRQRWAVRAMLDVVARERVEAERLAAMLDARGTYNVLSDTDRVARRMARMAQAGHTIVGYAPTKDGAWDEWTPRGITNAREARAAERGRGSHPRGPSAARVTTRDAHAPVWGLRTLTTVGVATHVDATPADVTTLLRAVMDAPTRATYRRYRGPVWPVAPWGADAVRPVDAHATYVARVRPCGPLDAGTVCPVWPDVDATPATHTGAHGPTSHVDARRAADVARMARMGSVYAPDDVG